MSLKAVYHELSSEVNIKDLRVSGLWPRLYSLRKRDMKGVILFEEWLDSKSAEFLPSHLRDRGFSRLNSVFAWPNLPQNMPRMVELIVGGEQSLVLPHDCYTSAKDFGMLDGNIFMERYWSEALLLEEFLERYQLRQLDNQYVWQDENGFPYIQPEAIFPPEAIKEFRRILP